MNKKYSNLSNWKYVFNEMCQCDKKYPLYIAMKSIAAFLAPFLAAVIPSVAIGMTEKSSEMTIFVISMIVLVTGNLLMGILSAVMDNVIKNKNFFVSYKAVQHKVVDQILTMDYSVLESAKGKDLADSAKYSYEVDWQGWNRLMDMYTPFVFNLLGIVIYCIILLPKCPWVLPVFLIMSIINIVLQRKVSLPGYRKYRKTIHETDSKVNYFYERSTSATDGKDIRMYRMEEWFRDIMRAMVKKRMSVWKYVELGYFWPCLSDTIWSLLRDIIAYSVLVLQFQHGRLNATDFTLYLGLIAGFAGWLNGGNMGEGFVRAYSEMLRCTWSIRDYRDFMALPNHEKETSEAPGMDVKLFNENKLGAQIEFQDVCFRYPEAKEDTIHNLNLKVNPGEKIALVGVNGAGKTTLMKMLCGFYKPTSGKIMVNGIDIWEYDLQQYQEKISAVFQDMMVMATTVAENVACKQEEEIDQERLWQCLELADIAQKVRSLPKQEKTSVTNFLDKEGVLFSGGELQRLLLARALYKDAPILLLDEPTSALDPLAETAIYEQYHKLAKDKTTFFISHRLASTKFCDRIVFYEGGSIKENGTHEELIKQNGEYAAMYLLQSQYYEKKGEESVCYE